MSGLSAANQSAIILALREGQRASNAELQKATGLAQRQIMRAATSLIRRGLIERVSPGVFALTAKGVDAKCEGTPVASGPAGLSRPKAKAPAPDSLRQRVWNAMPVMGKFSTDDIACVAADAPTEKDQTNVARYCRALCQAGFLMELPTRKQGSAFGSNGFKRYRLLPSMNTGTVAPTYRNRAQEVYDHNTGKVHSCRT